MTWKLSACFEPLKRIRSENSIGNTLKRHNCLKSTLQKTWDVNIFYVKRYVIKVCNLHGVSIFGLFCMVMILIVCIHKEAKLLTFSRPVATRSIRGQCPPNFLFHSNFCCVQKILFQTYTNKNLAPVNMYFVHPSLKTWLRAWRFH